MPLQMWTGHCPESSFLLLPPVAVVGELCCQIHGLDQPWLGKDTFCREAWWLLGVSTLKPGAFGTHSPLLLSLHAGAHTLWHQLSPGLPGFCNVQTLPSLLLHVPSDQEQTPTPLSRLPLHPVSRICASTTIALSPFDIIFQKKKTHTHNYFFER